MESIQKLYTIGVGPSSSHTIGPSKAAKLFSAEYPAAVSFQVVLFGSLSKTGKGHMTDEALIKAFYPNPCQVIFSDQPEEAFRHPNAMELTGLDEKGDVRGKWMVYSVGGGAIEIEGRPQLVDEQVYEHGYFDEIKEYCKEKNIRLYDYVYAREGGQIKDYLGTVWNQMKETIEKGLEAEGELPGGLGVQRKARYLYRQNHMDESRETKENRLVCAYAYAASEENATGGVVITAPTCGACGVVPAVMYYMQKKHGFDDGKIIDGLATAGLIGNLIKKNASISGAECGCQAEIGSACSMAAAGLAEIFDMFIGQIEYAAEVSMEHHLGLTCDPIKGLVQIPCIERNAVAAMRAINALSLANFLSDTRRISFDLVIKTMYETGKDLFSKYRETSEGGLAKLYFE